MPRLSGAEAEQRIAGLTGWTLDGAAMADRVA
jgi:hypothetical protein